MAFDYKKEYKEFYMPKKKPGIVTIPKKMDMKLILQKEDFTMRYI